ncbi:MAG TPA: hypothetical protein VIF12_02900 [Micavibrio sp.]|jgi:hypothetical protein
MEKNLKAQFALANLLQALTGPGSRTDKIEALDLLGCAISQDKSGIKKVISPSHLTGLLDHYKDDAEIRRRVLSLAGTLLEKTGEVEYLDIYARSLDENEVVSFRTNAVVTLGTMIWLQKSPVNKPGKITTTQILSLLVKAMDDFSTDVRNEALRAALNLPRDGNGSENLDEICRLAQKDRDPRNRQLGLSIIYALNEVKDIRSEAGIDAVKTGLSDSSSMVRGIALACAEHMMKNGVLPETFPAYETAKANEKPHVHCCGPEKDPAAIEGNRKIGEAAAALKALTP